MSERQAPFYAMNNQIMDKIHEYAVRKGMTYDEAAELAFLTVNGIKIEPFTAETISVDFVDLLTMDEKDMSNEQVLQALLENPDQNSGWFCEIARDRINRLIEEIKTLKGEK